MITSAELYERYRPDTVRVTRKEWDELAEFWDEMMVPKATLKEGESTLFGRLIVVIPDA